MNKFGHPKLRILDPKSDPRPWGEEILLTDTTKYMGKLLMYDAGKQGGLQYHNEKDETFHLVQGTGFMDYDRGDGTLNSLRMGQGDTIHIPTRAIHRFRAITDCVGYEFSTYHVDDRVRVEDQYPNDPYQDKSGLKTT